MIEYTCRSCFGGLELEGTFDPGYRETRDDPGQCAFIEGFDFDQVCPNCGASVSYEKVLESELNRRIL
jgi:rubrerythrin